MVMQMRNSEEVIYSSDKKIEIHTKSRQIIVLNRRITVSRNQLKLFIVLLGGQKRKDEIISKIWSEKPYENCLNNYHQLVFQTRKRLKDNNLPDSLLQTWPRNGLSLNTEALSHSFFSREDLSGNRLFRRILKKATSFISIINY